MGAKIMPTMKKRGRTVFGVKMGLSPRGQCRWFSLSALISHVLPRLQSLLSKCSIYAAISLASLCARPCPGLLGGLLLFVFLVSSRFGSWLVIESVASICCVCDMLPRNSAAAVVGAEVVLCWRSLTTLLTDAADALVAEPHPNLATDTGLRSPRSPLTKTRPTHVRSQAQRQRVQRSQTSSEMPSFVAQSLAHTL